MTLLSPGRNSTFQLYYKNNRYEIIQINVCCRTNGDAATADTSGTAIAQNAQVEDDKKLEANKEIARAFLQSLYGDKDSTAIDKYVADDIKQHDPILQDGKKWLMDLTGQILRNPNFEKTKVDIKYINAEDDMVWTLIREEAPNYHQCRSKACLLRYPRLISDQMRRYM